jgi:hypothetical protein
MMLRPMLRGWRTDDISPVLNQFVGWTSSEPPHCGESLLNSWIQRDVVRAKVFAEMRRFPVLLCPVAAIPAFKHGERNWQIEGRQVEYLDAWSYCEWFNLLGMPAVSVPAGQSEAGLPIGVQIAGLPWQEELILQVASTLEQLGGERCPPPGHALSAFSDGRGHRDRDRDGHDHGGRDRASVHCHDLRDPSVPHVIASPRDSGRNGDESNTRRRREDVPSVLTPIGSADR